MRAWVDSPSGVKTYPPRSATPTSRTAGPALRQVGDHVCEGPADLAEAEHEHIEPVLGRHRAAALLGQLKRGVHRALRLGRLGPSTTTLMFSSLEPCAIAMTLMLLADSAENTRVATPGVPCMPSPTIASVATPGRNNTPSMSRWAISSRNVSSRQRLARSPLALGHRKADRVLRGRLGDQRDRDLLPHQRRERPGGNAGHPQHAVAFDRDQCLSRRGR